MNKLLIAALLFGGAALVPATTFAQPIGPAVTVLSPNGGETWTIGQWADITWRRNWMPDGANGLVDIYYNRGGLNQFLAGGVLDSVGYRAVVPSSFSRGSDYKIVVTSRGSGGSVTAPLSDESDGAFRVVAATPPAVTPTITVLAPIGGSFLVLGESNLLRWSFSSTPQSTWSVDVDLERNDVFLGRINGLGIDATVSELPWRADSYYPEGIPTTRIPELGSGYVVKVVLRDGVGNPLTSARSSVFSIVRAGTPVITAISPSRGAQGETLDVVLEGRNFTGANSFSASGVSPISDRGFQLVSTNLISDTRVNLRVAIAANATVGPRNITVTVPGSTSNQATFTVVEPVSEAVASRDSRRIGDIRQLQLALELYYDRYWSYPVGLSQLYPAFIVSLLRDPLDGTDYSYRAIPSGCTGSQETTCKNYHLGANLETVMESRLVSDADQDSRFAGGFSGADNQSCFGGRGGIAYCYDVTNGDALSPATGQAIPDGSLIRARGYAEVWIVKGGYRRHIISPRVFTFYGHLGFAQVIDVGVGTVNQYTESRLIRAVGDGRVYELKPNGQKRWLNMYANQFLEIGHSPAEIYDVNAAERDFYATGSDLTPTDFGIGR